MAEQSSSDGTPLVSWLRSFLPAAASRKDRRRPGRGKPLNVERLEDRTLPSVTAIFSAANTKVLFQGSVGSHDDVALHSVNGVLQYSVDGGAYTATKLTMTNASVVQADIGGTLFLDLMTGAGGTIASTGAITVRDGVLVSTRQANGSAYSLVIQSPNITVGKGDIVTAAGSTAANSGDLQFVASSGLALTLGASRRSSRASRRRPASPSARRTSSAATSPSPRPRRPRSSPTSRSPPTP